MDIKESKELLKGLELVGAAGLKIAKDGKGSVSDLMHVVELVKKFDVLKDAVEGIDKIPAELKDIDEAEIVELGAAAFGLIKALKEAYASEA